MSQIRKQISKFEKSQIHIDKATLLVQKRFKLFFLTVLLHKAEVTFFHRIRSEFVDQTLSRDTF